MVGIGLYKGVRNINFRLLGQIAAGWIATPVITCMLAYLSLFFFSNMFNINVGKRVKGDFATHDKLLMNENLTTSEIMRYLLMGILVAGAIIVLYYFLLERKKRKELLRSEERFWKNIK